MGKKDFDFDYIIIGSGAAGSAAASVAAEAHLKTAIVEASTWGGSGLNGKAVAPLASYNFSRLYSDARAGSRMGISSASLHYNYPTALNWQSFAEKRSGVGSKKTFENAGITCLDGFANFLSPYEIAVGNRRVTSANFLIATGASLYNGDISGVEELSCLTPDSALRIRHLPKSIFIIGGGATGCELAEYFAELGVATTICDLSRSLLPREDGEASKILELYLSERLKVKILTQSRVISVSNCDTGKKITFLRGGLTKSVIAEEIVLATGSKPCVDLGLGNTGVDFSSGGIVANRYLQTSIKHIYAAGDVLGNRDSSTEIAAYEGALATINIINRTRNLTNYSGFTRVVNTYPLVAAVGLTEEECLTQNLKIKKSLVALSSTFASNIADFRAGFVKIIADAATNKILGATVVSPQADAIIQELALAVRFGLTVIQVASTPHVASSWSEAVRLAARKLAK